MTRLVYFTPRTTACRLAARLVATTASHLPPRVLKRVVAPLLRSSRATGRLRRPADRVIFLIVGDGAWQRVARQHRRARRAR